MPTLLRQDRDRYVAFAFAAADMLLELDQTGRIIAVNGAVHAVCGHKPAALAGTLALELIAENDRAVARRAMGGLAGAGRIDPLAVRVKHKDGSEAHALLGICGLPSEADRRFLTVTLLPPAVASAAGATPRDPATGLLGKDALFTAALAGAGANAHAKRMTLIQLGGLTSAVDKLPEERGRELMAEIGAALRARSAGGDTAARLGGDEFGLIAAKTGGIENADAIRRELGEAARSAGILDGLIETRFGSITLAQGTLDDRDAAKALAYAVRRFCETRGEFTLTSLQDGFVDEVTGALTRYDQLQRLIGEGRFQLVFQPVVRLGDRQIHHYEALSRFPDGQSPYDMIRFGEGVGLVEPLDLAVARLAIDLIGRRTADTKIAINVSGRSVQSDRFRKHLAALLKPAPGIGDRLTFELTESWAIEQIDEAANFLRWLRQRGHLVCLDDFGAGATAYNYLRHFEVDFVKIDGPFLKSATKNARDAVLVSSICRLCETLNHAVIGEMIETESEAEAAARMGIGFGQGWLFGRPEPELPASGSPALARVAAGRS
ncbi:MAG TPA: EAL domain-containing protein [Stellaceae bacterium]|nr:EAL domain-containing protein [Stellaceae bacterium]